MKNKRVLNSIHKKLKQRKKKYSKSILATNKLHAKSDIFRTSYLFKKPGKRRIYNPNAKYFEHGGPHEVFLSAGKFRPQTPTIGSTLGYKQVFPKRETTWSLTGNLGYGRNLETDKEGLSASINAENFGKFFGGQRRVNAITNLQAFVEPGNYGAQVYAGPNLHWGSHPKRRLPRGTGRVDFQPFNMRFGYQSTPLAADSGDALFEGTGGRMNYGLGTKLKGEYALPKKGALRGSKMNPVLFGDVGVDFDFLRSNYDEEGVASGSIYGVPEGFTINPSFAANVGIRLPIDGINLGRRRKPSLVEDDPYYNPGIRVSDPEAVEAYEEPDEYQDGGTPKVKQRRGVRQNYGEKTWTPSGLQFPTSVSSHLMTTEYIPGRGWVSFPSLFQDSKPYADDQQNWVDMSGEEDWMKIYEEAERRGEVYDFGEDKEAALAFGEGSWKDQLPQQKHGGLHGGPGSPPTQADSLRVYNQAVKLQNFYDKQLGNQLVLDPDPEYDLSRFTEDMNERGDLIRQQHLEHPNVSFMNKTLMRSNTDPNVEYLSDIVTGMIDPKAPLAIYDKRIKPAGIKSYMPRRRYYEEKYLEDAIFNISGRNIPQKNYDVHQEFLDAFDDMKEQVEQDYEFPDVLDPNYEKRVNDWFTNVENETYERLRNVIKKMYPSKVSIYDEFLKKFKTTRYGDAPGAFTTIPYYDPIMVKPWSMLTEEEKEYRRKFKPKPKGTLDPKKSVNVNLIKLGLATDTKSANVVKKELYAKLFPGEEYKGKADQNTKLNKYIFDNNLAKEDIEEVINPSVLPPPAPPQYEIEPVVVEPEISPLPVMPAVLPSDLGDVEIVGDVAEEDFDNDYRAKRIVDKEKYYKVNKKGKLRRGPFGTQTIRRVRYEPIEEEQIYPEGYVPMFQSGGALELGDEVDEATMKRLKKLGYTFEEI